MSETKGVQFVKEWDIKKYGVKLTRFSDHASSYSGRLIDWLDDNPDNWDWGAVEAMESMLLDLASQDIEITEEQLEKLITSTLDHLAHEKCKP